MVEKYGKENPKFKLEDLDFTGLEKEVINILKSGEKNSIKKAEDKINKFVDEHV